MEIVLLIIGLAAGAIGGFLIAKFKYSSITAGNADPELLRSENTKLVADLAKAEQRGNMLSADLDKSKQDLDKERIQSIDLKTELSKIETLNKGLEEKLESQRSEIEERQKQLVVEFENLANRILEDKSRKFTEQNKENIASILDPLKVKITDFEKRVNDVYDSENKGRAALSEQLRNLQDLNKQMSEDATNLTRALKGDTKQQGNWGEFILESVLEKSGLVKGREYFIQQTFKGDDGSMLRPDVVVTMPDSRSMVIDSKVSLNAYEAYSSANNEEERERALADHVNSIKRHIKGLSPKDYQNLYGLNSLDFVLMFVPIEPAFAAAVQKEPNIFNEAFDKNIVIVSPSTLLATLRTVANIWKQEMQNRNALEIAKQSGALYDKFAGFVDDLVNIGKRLDSTKESYSEAMKKLSEGSGNLVNRVEKIKKLGAKATKSIDQRIVDRSDDDNDSDDGELKLLNSD